MERKGPTVSRIAKKVNYPSHVSRHHSLSHKTNKLFFFSWTAKMARLLQTSAILKVLELNENSLSGFKQIGFRHEL